MVAAVTDYHAKSRVTKAARTTNMHQVGGRVGIPMVRDVVAHGELEAVDPLGMADKPEAVMATVTVEAADAPMMTPAFPMKCGSSYLRVSKMF